MNTTLRRQRIGWRGVAVELHAPQAVLNALDAHLPSFYTTDGDVVASAEIGVEHDVLTAQLPDGLSFSGAFDDETLRATASRIELSVCTRLRDRVAVHAGVVAVDGLAIVLPGSSMAGKSTLVAALLELGAVYFSDEFALFDEHGLVWPYPRRMTLRGEAGRERVLPGSAANPSGPPLPLGLVADLKYADGGWDVADLGAAHSVLALMENSPAARTASEHVMSALAAAVAHRPPAWRGRRGDAADAAGRLVAALR